MRRIVLVAIACFVIAAAALYYLHPWASAGAQSGEDPYTRFEMEAFALIQKNYWQQASDAQLAQLFEASLEKASSATSSIEASDATSTAQMFEQAFAALSSSTAKENLALDTLQVVLYNLAPAGRDELLSSQAQAALSQDVDNVNPSTNLYQELGVASSATPAQIQSAYDATRAEIEASTTASTSQALARAQYDDDVLSNPQSRAAYDSTGAEPTVFSHVLGTTLYLDVDKISPTTLDEFTNAVDAASSTPLSSMIIDLRGNIGGDLDLAPGFIGLFIGNDQYAFDLYQQGNLNVIRTDEPELPALARYRQIAVLTDDMTQSTAEVLTAAFERFHLATVVGATTRGWGTVENTYPLSTSIDASTSYALLLVNSVTLRPDGNPIEGAGVDPDVSISDPDWKSALSTYFSSQSLISAIEKVVPSGPLQ